MTEDKKLLNLIPYPGCEQSLKQMPPKVFYIQLLKKNHLLQKRLIWRGVCLKKRMEFAVGYC
jgi:hypothetical protein